MLVFLRVKIKSLAAEAAIIRKDERKWKGRWHAVANLEANDERSKQRRERAHQAFFGLKGHRTGKVRSSARSAQLAYGFLRGKSYSSMETPKHGSPDWDQVAKDVMTFGPYQLPPNNIRAKLVLWSTPAEPAA